MNDKENKIRILKNAIKYYKNELAKPLHGKHFTLEEYKFWKNKLNDSENKLYNIENNSCV